jgi:hypothetical protein
MEISELTQNQIELLSLRNRKKDYEPCVLTVINIEMEQGIAAGSARVTTTNNVSGDVEASWETTEDQDAIPF